jgi:hypothetical protein
VYSEKYRIEAREMRRFFEINLPGVTRHRSDAAQADFPVVSRHARTRPRSVHLVLGGGGRRMNERTDCRDSGLFGMTSHEESSSFSLSVTSTDYTATSTMAASNASVALELTF